MLGYKFKYVAQGLCKLKRLSDWMPTPTTTPRTCERALVHYRLPYSCNQVRKKPLGWAQAQRAGSLEEEKTCEHTDTHREVSLWGQRQLQTSEPQGFPGAGRSQKEVRKGWPRGSEGAQACQHLGLLRLLPQSQERRNSRGSKPPSWWSFITGTAGHYIPSSSQRPHLLWASQCPGS